MKLIGVVYLLEMPKATEIDLKFEAQMMLANSRNAIIVPTQDEMIGFYLLERDDQLPLRKEKNDV